MKKVPATWFAIGAATTSVAVLALHASRYWPFIADDAFISLRYSARLNGGHGLTWDDYERVEGYSNLLWVLACAAVARLGVSLVTAARLLAFASMATAIAAVALGNRSRPASAWTGAMLLALAGPCAIWAIGGLEQPLAAALLALGLVPLLAAVDRDAPPPRMLLAAGMAFGLMALTRPDGPLFALVFSGVTFALHARTPTWRKPAALLIAPTLVFVGLQLAFRVTYYGDWVPNTAHVKLGLSGRRLHEGLLYVWRGWGSFSPILLPLALGTVVLLRRRASRARAILLLAALIAWNAYLVFIGGDIFAGFRHHVLTLVLLAFLAAECVAAGASAPRRVARVATYIVAAGSLALFFRVQRTHPQNLWAKDERWEWECQKLAEPFGRAFRSSRPLVAVDPAGCFPFFSELPSVDMLGLNDRYIATHPPPNADRKDLAHGLGHGGYVLSRHPDVAIFCTPRGGARACFESGVELDGSREFHAAYRLVGFALEGQRGAYWVRFESPKIGVRVEDGHLEIPGFLFGAGPREDAIVDGEGNIGASLGPGAPARIEDVPVARGQYRVGLQPAMAATIRVLRWDKEPLELHEGDVFELDVDSRVDLEVLPMTESFLRSVRLQKL